MIHTYTVTGMTCNGCKASVEKALQAIDYVTNVSVDLENAEATLTMSKHISTQQLQDALSSKYTIQAKTQTKNVFASATSLEEEKPLVKQLFPLFLIFGYI